MEIIILRIQYMVPCAERFGASLRHPETTGHGQYELYAPSHW